MRTGLLEGIQKNQNQTGHNSKSCCGPALARASVLYPSSRVAGRDVVIWFLALPSANRAESGGLVDTGRCPQPSMPERDMRFCVVSFHADHRPSSTGLVEEKTTNGTTVFHQRTPQKARIELEFHRYQSCQLPPCTYQTCGVAPGEGNKNERGRGQFCSLQSTEICNAPSLLEFR